MRLRCPFCGARDRREFTYQGAEVMLARPARDAGAEEWDAYLHVRDNPAGLTRDLWYHDPCGAWITVTRDTLTHVVHDTELVDEGGA